MNCTDKTGTLTKNEMTVIHYVFNSGDIEVSGEDLETDGQFLKDNKPTDPDEHSVLSQALQIGIVCSDAELAMDSDEHRQAIGEPVEVALLVLGAKACMQRKEVLKADSAHKVVEDQSEVDVVIGDELKSPET